MKIGKIFKSNTSAIVVLPRHVLKKSGLLVGDQIVFEVPDRLEILIKSLEGIMDGGLDEKSSTR